MQHQIQNNFSIFREQSCFSELYFAILSLIMLFQMKSPIAKGNKITMKKDDSTLLSVLHLPPQSSFLPVDSPSSDYKLFHHAKIKSNLAVLNVNIPNIKLLNNLEIYEWRKQTDFPIVKTFFVNVKKKTHTIGDKVELEVFTEHCPLKLNRIYEMSTSQTFFIIKEALIGFQRLHKKFGSFQLKQTMITINEKGFCRVWGNSDYALNQFNKNRHTETQMMHQLLTMIQKHCMESKINKKLFFSLKQCKTFLQALKMIENLTVTEKIFIPNRFSILRTSKEKNKDHYKEIIQYCKSIDLFKTERNKFSTIIHKKPNKILASSSDLQRIKSVEKVLDLKISGGETVCSFNKDHKSSSSVKKLQFKHKTRKRADNSILLINQTEPLKKNKKQLTHSEAMIKNIFQPKSLKYSEQLSLLQHQKSSNLQFNSAKLSLTEQSKYLSSPETNTPVTIIGEEENRKQEHSFRIIKENGWKPKFTDLFKNPKVLKESIEFKKEGETINKEEIQLEQLGKLAKKRMTASILSEQNPEENY